MKHSHLAAQFKDSRRPISTLTIYSAIIINTKLPDTYSKLAPIPLTITCRSAHWADARRKRRTLCEPCELVRPTLVRVSTIQYGRPEWKWFWIFLPTRVARIETHHTSRPRLPGRTQAKEDFLKGLLLDKASHRSRAWRNECRCGRASYAAWYRQEKSWTSPNISVKSLRESERTHKQAPGR